MPAISFCAANASFYGGLINFFNYQNFVYEKATAFFQAEILCYSGIGFVIFICSIQKLFQKYHARKS